MAKTRIRFNAEPHHVLRASGQEIWGGTEGNVDSDVAETLAAATWVDVTIVDGKARWPRTNEALDAIAQALEVEFPDPVAEGTKPLDVAEKIALLEAAGYSPSDGAEALDPKKKKQKESE